MRNLQVRDSICRTVLQSIKLGPIAPIGKLNSSRDLIRARGRTDRKLCFSLAGDLDFSVRQAVGGEDSQAEAQRCDHGHPARERHSDGAHLAPEALAGKVKIRE